MARKKSSAAAQTEETIQVDNIDGLSPETAAPKRRRRVKTAVLSPDGAEGEAKPAPKRRRAKKADAPLEDAAPPSPFAPEEQPTVSVSTREPQGPEAPKKVRAPRGSGGRKRRVNLSEVLESVSSQLEAQEEQRLLDSNATRQLAFARDETVKSESGATPPALPRAKIRVGTRMPEAEIPAAPIPEPEAPPEPKLLLPELSVPTGTLTSSPNLTAASGPRFGLSPDTRQQTVAMSSSMVSVTAPPMRPSAIRAIVAVAAGVLFLAIGGTWYVRSREAQVTAAPPVTVSTAPPNPNSPPPVIEMTEQTVTPEDNRPPLNALVQAIQDERRAAVEGCYLRAWKRNPTLPDADIKAEVDVSKKRAINAVRVTDNMANPNFTKCVVVSLWKSKLPAGLGSGTIDLRFGFDRPQAL